MVKVRFNDQPIQVRVEGAALVSRQAALAQDAAEAAQSFASAAEAFAGPTFPDTAAGLAGTTDGQSFAVNEDGIVTIYLNDEGDAVAQRVIATTAALASPEPGKGAGMVGYSSRTVKAKLDDWTTPLDLGAVGDGVTDDTDAIDAAFATGKHVVFPRGYTFLTNTIYGHAYAADGQVVEMNGDLQYTGTRHAMGPYTGVFALIRGFQKERIKLIGSGRLLGKRTGGSLLDGDLGSGLHLSNCPQPTVDGVLFTDLIEDAMKFQNCPEINVGRQTRVFYVRNVGLELDSYSTNPYAGIVDGAWTGTIYGCSGNVDGTYEWIDDGSAGSANGCGIDFSAQSGAPAHNNLRVSGYFRDCLRGVWSENNYAGSEAYNIEIVGVRVEGNIRGAATAACKDAVGLVGVKRGAVRGLRAHNPSNIASLGETAMLHLVGCDQIEVEDARLFCTSGMTDRTQYGIRLNGSTNVTIRGGGQENASIAPIVKAASNTGLRVQGFRGGTLDEEWDAGIVRYTFGKADVAASTNGKLDANAIPGVDAIRLPAPGRVVSISARLSGSIGTAVVSLTAVSGGVTQITATQANFSGATGGNEQSGTSAAQLAKGALIEARYNVDSNWAAGNDITVDIYVDHSWKAAS